MDKSIYNNPWFVYIAECSDKTFYVGIALDAEKRIQVHNKANGCKYTRCRKPVNLVYKELCLDYNTARKREFEIRRFPRKKKLEMVSKFGRGG